MIVTLSSKTIRELLYRVLLVIGVISAVVIFLNLVFFFLFSVPDNSPAAPSNPEQQTPAAPKIPTVSVTAQQLVQLYKEDQPFLCVNQQLFVIINEQPFRLADERNREIVCKAS